MFPIILSRIQVLPILEAHNRKDTLVTTSLDLSLTTTELVLAEDGFITPEGETISWAALQTVAKKDNNCYYVDQDELIPVRRFSEEFNRSYTLRATTGAPTLLISGFPMHRIKDTTPDKDTATKIKAPGALGERVLDTTTGLGYTAIAAAKANAKVTTVELDPEVLNVARYNPWSRQLFQHENIRQMIGSSFEVIKDMRSGEFDTILHDPPTFSLAGELYSQEFYSHALRVLRNRGKLFHYIGDLESKSGRVVAKGVVNRLQQAGFRRIVRHQEAFGLVAQK